MPLPTAVATIHTTLGDIKVNLFGNHAPITVDNFVGLATGAKEWKHPRTGEVSTKPLYDGVIFHRIIPGFMIQGGDPLGQGVGGPGYTFNDEIHPELQFDRPYLLAMANAGVRRNPVTGEAEGTNGSQFFVSTVPTPWLNGKHTIFGEVADDESRAVVDAINATPTRPGDRPQEDIVITSVTIED
jgi:peptidyl-prolyl cis-trans isomerase A (cyclophilin A)